MMLVISALLSFLACVWLALSQARHSRTLGLTQDLSSLRTLRWAGQAALGASFLASVIADGVSFGVLLWFLLVAFFAAVTALLLAYVPSALRTFVPWTR